MDNQINSAFQLQQAEDFLGAEKIYQEILSREPDNVDALNLLGLLKYQCKQFREAEFFVKKALSINKNAYFYDNLGRIYLAQEKIQKAIDIYNKALSIEPDNFDLYFNLAYSHKKNMQQKLAIETYKKALLINPRSFEANFNLGNLFEEENDTSSAIDFYKTAVELYPENIEANYFLAISKLKLKEFDEGWTLFENRPSKIVAILSQLNFYKDIFALKPLWEGEDIQNKSIYVYFEGGFGDTIMFARYLPLLKDKCLNVLCHPQDGLLDLLKHNFSEINFSDSIGVVKKPNFDVHIPMMSLPFALKMNDKIPYTSGFLKADYEKKLDYEQKYFNNNSFKIGIKWQGNPDIDQTRTISLSSFSKLFDLPNTQFYSLQKDISAIEADFLSKNSIIDLGKTFNDFSDTSAAIEGLDLVICNDTSVAHLAGALGKPCWILLPTLSNWRWHNDKISIWYDSVRIFKQKERGNWDELFDKIFYELEKERDLL